MNEELKILIAAILDKAKSENNINTQLKQLKLDTLKLNIDIGNGTFGSGIGKQVQESIRQTQATVDNNPINMKIIADQRSLKGLQEQLKALTAQFKGIDKYAQGKLITNNVGAISGAEVTYNDPHLQQTITQTYELDTATNQLYNSQNKLIDNSAKQATTQKKLAESMRVAKEQSLNFASGIDSQIKDIDSKTLKRSKPLLPDSKQFEDYNSKLIETKEKISEITSQNEILSDSHRRQINSMVKDLERYASELQTSAYASDKLKPDTFPNAKNQALKEFDTTSQNWLSNSFITDEFKSNLLETKKLLDNAFDSTGLDEYKAKIKLLGEDFKQLRNSNKNDKFDANLGLDKIKLDNRITAWLNENQKAAKMFGLDLKNIQAQINDADRTQLGNLTKQFQGVQTQAKSLGLTGRTVFGELENSAKKFASWLAVGNIVAPLFRGIRETINNVRELDKALVDLQMATGGSRSQTQELLNSYVDLGKELGATTTEVANSANGWLRQGKSVEETNTLIKNSMILSKVGMIESAQATEYLTSAMKGYKVETSDTLGIVDKLATVDMKSATSAGGLAEAMSRTANSADIAGVSMDKLIGYMATVGEVTQKEMSSIGESFKTIFSRMGNIKIGKFVDDETGESLSDVESVLGKLDIKLRANDTTFRNFGDVLDDVGNRWGSFNDVEQSSIAVAIAGVRQRENFLTLMENYGTALGYAETAANSTGTALEKMDNYEQGVEKSQKALTASFEGFSNAVLNSGLIKGTFDAGSGILGFFTELIKNLGILPTLAVTAAGALSGIKNIGISKVKYAPLCLSLGRAA